MGTFENTVKLNNNSILGRIVERVKNKISLEDITTHELTIKLDDFEDLDDGFSGYKITPPEGTYISEIDADILANRTAQSANSTSIAIIHGVANSYRVRGTSVLVPFPTTALSLCVSSRSYYNPTSKIATGFSTSAYASENLTVYTATTTSNSIRSTYSSNNDGSITIITDESNLSDITIHISYKLSKL